MVNVNFLDKIYSYKLHMKIKQDDVSSITILVNVNHYTVTTFVLDFKAFNIFHYLWLIACILACGLNLLSQNTHCTSWENGYSLPIEKPTQTCYTRATLVLSILIQILKCTS